MQKNGISVYITSINNFRFDLEEKSWMNRKNSACFDDRLLDYRDGWFYCHTDFTRIAKRR